MNNLSYARNTTEYSIIRDTLGSRMRHWSKTQPDKAAIVVYMSQEIRAVMTFGELFDKAMNLAKYYISVGVRPGDRVAVFVYNSPEFLVTTVACFLAGAVAINSYTFASESDLNLVQKIGCKVLVADMRHLQIKAFILNNLEKLRNQGFEIKTIGIEDEGSNSSQYDVNFYSACNGMENCCSLELPDFVNPEEVAAVFQTSGSTGIPKFAPLSHAKLLNNLHCLYSKMGLTNEDIFFSDRPMGYMAGFPMPPFIFGCTFVTLNSQRTVRDKLAENMCKILKLERVTCGYFPPYLVYDLEKLKMNSPEEIPSFKCMVTSGQRISKNLLQMFQEYAEKPCMGYGSTEMGWVTCADVTELPDVDDDIIAGPLPGIEMKIVDSNGDLVPHNTEGEICVRDPYNFGSYFTASGGEITYLDEQGWHHTGDVGYLLDDGKNFCIKGRLVEMIKRSTIKIYPAVVETILWKHPAVAEVVVVGIPDERLYQEVCACVTVRAGMELTVKELRAFSEEQFNPEQSPDGRGFMPGCFLIFENFPKLPSQKVNRREISNMAQKLAKEII